MSSERDVWAEAQARARANGDTFVPGHELLDEVHATLTSFIIFPGEHASVAYTLWIAATHAQPKWEHATRFVFNSPMKRCGKTRAQEVGRELAHRVISTVNISPAALVRSIDETDPPTLFIDEADTIFGKRKEETAEDLRGIINSGHSRGWPYLRWNMKTRELEECQTYAMALLAGIGALPDTIEDRAIVISLRRRAPGETVAQWRNRRVVPRLRQLHDRLHAWVHSLDLDEIDLDLPVEDRDADKWEPLVAIADAAGGDWGKRARAACLVLCGAETTGDGTDGEQLLADLEQVWETSDGGPVTAMSTESILKKLEALDESPWGERANGKPLAAREVAKLLRPFGVRSITIKISKDYTPKGYKHEDLAPVWARYTHAAATNATNATTDEGEPVTCENRGGGSVADSDPEAATHADLPKHSKVADVADVAGGTSANDPEREKERIGVIVGILDGEIVGEYGKP
jgi:hypothetical protein